MNFDVSSCKNATNKKIELKRTWKVTDYIHDLDNW